MRIQLGVLWRVLGLCVLSVGASEQDGSTEEPRYQVSISGSTVELTCPFEDESTNLIWEINMQEQSENTKILTIENFSEMDDSGYYRCYSNKNKEKSFYLYLRARVCDNCFEVSVMQMTIIIAADLCVTLGLLLFVNHWSKKRKAKTKPVTRAAGTGGQPRGKTTGQNKRPPPVPSPDYEPIRKGQQDTYAGLNHRGI